MMIVSRRASGAIILAAALLAATPGPAQDFAPGPAQESAPVPVGAIVISSGKATVYTPPTHAVFWIHRTIAAEKLNLALRETTGADIAVREAVTVRELRPALLETSAPAVDSLHENTVRISTELHFLMLPYASGESALIKFGELCEQIKEIGAALGGEVTGPELMTTENRAVVREAVRAAVKEAHPGAAGAAEAMNVALVSVDAIEVGEVTWNAPPDTEAAYPTLAQLSCTAEVKVTYIAE